MSSSRSPVDHELKKLILLAMQTFRIPPLLLHDKLEKLQLLPAESKTPQGEHKGGESERKESPAAAEGGDAAAPAAAATTGEDGSAAVAGDGVATTTAEGGDAVAGGDAAEGGATAKGAAETQAQMDALEAELIAAKDLFGPYTRVVVAKVSLFDRIMRALDIFGRLKGRIRKDYNGQVVTNAWLKMYEILSSLPLRGAKGAELLSFHNAELPGAFVSATNHFMLTRHPGVAHRWVASSFYPPSAKDLGYSALMEFLGDRYGLYSSNRDAWVMGPAPQPSGDLTDADQIDAVSAEVMRRFPAGVDLYTSDAGVDVSGDYNAQETTTALLNFGQVLSGLCCLAPGGALVTKQFTFFRPFTRSLIAVVSGLFDSLSIVKPRTSRPTNSEVYLVGTGFRGLPSALRAQLIARVRARDTTTPLLSLAGQAAVEAALMGAANRLYREQQVPFVRKAVALMAECERGGLDSRALALRLEPFEREATDRWLQTCPVQRLNSAQWLRPGKPGAEPRR
jgi:cap2 methyltransferase